MRVFNAYARYYDLLYRDKDYTAEAEYVHQIIQRYVPGAVHILELGCGTGRHAQLLAEKGNTVVGVDLSERMLTQAITRRETLPIEIADRLIFTVGDIRTVRMGHSFDAVIALFHVVSYQTTNDDLKAVFKTAAVHLNSGGAFIFDCWYGPAVLTQKPQVRVKRLEDDEIRITRIAEPELCINDCMVVVNYTVFVEEKATGRVQQLGEMHRMRYLFAPELREMLMSIGLGVESEYGWMTNHIPSERTWGTCFVSKYAKR